MVVSSAVLVFREGLEAILVLAAVTAGLARSGKGYERGVVVGSAIALLATVATWFIVVAVISESTRPSSTCRRPPGCWRSSCCSS